jgi:hypothetical protein
MRPQARAINAPCSGKARSSWQRYFGPQADLNLGLTTYLNGPQADQIQIDTSDAATDTIDYVAADPSGLTSTSTPTVIIQAAATTGH